MSAAAIFHLREQLDGAGFDKVRIVASSGFDVHKCRVMADVRAPIDVIGTGSYLPGQLDARPTPPPTSSPMTARRVKIGREFLIQRKQAAEGDSN